ncbi:MAG: hypothetical protein CM1200mP29_09720 [Verrucomicrobiota bacterium]|nr:MAG: hypothetical protein CM1200mP29_09720 [Verrucomicrobiota bacterium]
MAHRLDRRPISRLRPCASPAKCGKPSELTLLQSRKGSKPAADADGVGILRHDAGVLHGWPGGAAAQKRCFKRLAIALPDGDLVRAATEGCVYGSYEQPKYKSDDSNSPLEET